MKSRFSGSVFNASTAAVSGYLARKSLAMSAYSFFTTSKASRMIVPVPPLLNSFMDSSTLLLRSRKQTILPKRLRSLSTRLVRENACNNPWYSKFLSTYNVFSFLESKPVRNIPTTKQRSSGFMSVFFFFNRRLTSS